MNDKQTKQMEPLDLSQFEGQDIAVDNVERIGQLRADRRALIAEVKRGREQIKALREGLTEIADQLQRAMSDDAAEADFEGCAEMRDKARALLARVPS